MVGLIYNESSKLDIDTFGAVTKCSPEQLIREHYGQAESTGAIESGVIDDGGTGSDAANAVGQTPDGRSEENAGTVAPESRAGQGSQPTAEGMVQPGGTGVDTVGAEERGAIKSTVAPPLEVDQATLGTQYWFWCSYLDNPR